MKTKDGVPQAAREAAAIVLAGGRSRRMRQDKALLPLGGEPLIRVLMRQLERIFPRILICVSAAGRYEFLGRPLVLDERPSGGPMIALLSGLRASPCDLNFVIACDIPFIDSGFVGRMRELAGDCQAVVPRYRDGKLEPLFAFYRRGAVPVLETLLSRGIRKIADLYDHLPTRFVPADDQSWLVNVNTSTDYRRLVRRLGSGQPATGRFRR